MLFYLNKLSVYLYIANDMNEKKNWSQNPFNLLTYDYRSNYILFKVKKVHLSLSLFNEF